MNWSELRQAYRVFLENPSQGILHIIAAGQQSHWQRWVTARLAQQATPLAHTMIDINLDYLSQLPEDSLGGAYAKHLLSQGFDPAAFVTSNQYDWVEQRLALSHDVHHVMTGFNSTPVGEFGLAAFVLLQYRDLLNVFVLSHLPWFMVGHIMLAPQAIASVIRGIRQGLVCKPIFAYPFEANWHKPLIEVRQELGL
ncbi:MAG: Coq4 family protein [Oculatellaceae cyanobacterium bins.114]|nr:Coq4 family protein [Oculatellaceae cyanobacterium bins.114]